MGALGLRFEIVFLQKLESDAFPAERDTKQQVLWLNATAACSFGLQLRKTNRAFGERLAADSAHGLSRFSRQCAVEALLDDVARQPGSRQGRCRRGIEIGCERK